MSRITQRQPPLAISPSLTRRAGMLALLLLATNSSVALCEPAKAPSSVLDLIPADAAFSLGVDNLAKLKTKGDRFITEAKLDLFIRPSQLFELGLSYYWTVPKEIDRSRPLAIVLANFEKSKVSEPGFEEITSLLVFVSAISDDQRNAYLKRKGLSKEDAVAGKALKVGTEYVLFNNGCGYFGRNRLAVVATANAKTIAKSLDNKVPQQIASADMTFQFGTEAWGEIWKNAVRDTRELMLADEEGKGSPNTQDMLATIEQAEFAIGAFQMEPGLRLSLLTKFQEDEAGRVKRFLSTIRGGDGSSSLKALPTGELIAAAAASGDGNRNLNVTRALLVASARPWTKRGDDSFQEVYSQILDVFAGVWQELNGSRVGIYRTNAGGGLVSAVAILDANDADKLIEQFPTILNVAKASGKQLGEDVGLGKVRIKFVPKAEKIDGSSIGQVVLDPLSVSEEVRKAATQLLGAGWHTVRVVAVGKQVVLLLGSDKELFETAFRNVKAGKPGLAASGGVLAGSKQLDERKKAEFHVSFQRSNELWSLLNGKKEVKSPGKEPASFGLTLEEQWIGFDVWVPTEGVKVFMNQ